MNKNTIFAEKKNQMKKNLILLLTLICGSYAFGQNVYDETIDANSQLKEAISKAKVENKFVLAQVGGNWCKWCLMFHDFATTNEQVSSIIKENFVYIHVNYSPKNKNEETMKLLGNPQRFGFPVFVLLNQEGEIIHTQDSSLLEEGNGYSEKKVIRFLTNWTASAISR
jgi:thioredoxin-related protein